MRESSTRIYGKQSIKYTCQHDSIIQNTYKKGDIGDIIVVATESKLLTQTEKEMKLVHEELATQLKGLNNLKRYAEKHKAQLTKFFDEQSGKDSHEARGITDIFHLIAQDSELLDLIRLQHQISDLWSKIHGKEIIELSLKKKMQETLKELIEFGSGGFRKSIDLYNSYGLNKWLSECGEEKKLEESYLNDLNTMVIELQKIQLQFSIYAQSLERRSLMLKSHNAKTNEKIYVYIGNALMFLAKQARNIEMHFYRTLKSLLQAKGIFEKVVQEQEAWHHKRIAEFTKKNLWAKNPRLDQEEIEHYCFLKKLL